MAKILAFAGSKRTGSYNRRVLNTAVKAAEAAGASVTVLEMGDYELPLFCEDLESASFPDNAMKLKELFKSHDGLLIACPEYNSSITPLLKNTIDWVSRPTGDSSPLEAFDGKYAGLVAASPGAIGGLRGLFHVRDILQNIRVTVLPAMAAVAGVSDKLADDDTITDDNLRGMVEGVGRSLAQTLLALEKGRG